MTRPDVTARPIELRHLRYFVAVAEERHFTRAAARLHIAQPPLSAQIRQLERRLGTSLFDRTPGRVSLTAAGQALLEAAYATLATVDEGVEAVRAVASGRRGRVRVAVSPTVALAHPLAAVAALARRAPEVYVDLIRADDAESALRARSAGVAFLRAPVRDRSLPHAVIASEGRAVLAPDRHALARSTQARLADLAGHDIVEPPEGGFGAGRRTGSVEQLLARVAAGDALAVVPEGLARELPPGIAAIPLVDGLPSEIVVVGPAPEAGAAAAAYVEAVRAAGRGVHVALGLTA